MTPAERVYRASRVYAAAVTYFAHWADSPDAAAIEAAHRAYLEAVLATGDRRAFTRATMRFLATFRNGHTLFLDRRLATEGGSLPFSARTVGDRWVVTASRAEALRAGDVLETIDGRPFEEFFRDQRPLVATSTEPGRRAPSRVGPYGTPTLSGALRPRPRGRTARRGDRRSMPPGAGSDRGRWLDPARSPTSACRSSPQFEKRAVELGPRSTRRPRR
jgi:hypothetical protein